MATMANRHLGKINSWAPFLHIGVLHTLEEAPFERKAKIKAFAGGLRLKKSNVSSSGTSSTGTRKSISKRSKSCYCMLVINKQ
jgi:hypothetical protein